MSSSRALPALVLATYAVAFGAAAFGGSLPAFDDHPGQVYRLSHALSAGPAPSAWDPGWWAGYPELQFYPPGFFYLGLLLHGATLGALPAAAVYQTLLWLTWLLPGVSAWLALTSLLGDGWLALPGAFVALTLSAGVTSGVEGGVHVGMLPARLAWAFLPLVFVVTARWMERPGRRAATGVGLAVLLAAIVLTHPAHAPSAVALVLLGAGLGAGPRRQRLVGSAGLLTLAASLTAFWTVPLLFRLEQTRALAWGSFDIGLHRPLPLTLVLLAAIALRARESRPATLLALWPWSAAALVAADALVLEPIGVQWLPADRVVDGAWMAVVLAAGHSIGRLIACARARAPLPVSTCAAGALFVLVALSVPDATLGLWPDRADWPSYEATIRGLRLDDLWAALRAAPPGRVLFVRSGVPLVFGTAWWRPHTHVTALTPIHAGRAIVNGTFTHPSPVAALVYRGAPTRATIRTLAEQLDGRSLFGRPLARLGAATLDAYADRLGVSVIIALEEDVPTLPAVAETAFFVPAAAIGPFRIYTRRSAVTLPVPDGPGRWRLAVPDAPAGTWIPAHVTDYPLWSAERGGAALETRRGPAWDLEVRLDGGTGPVWLVYRRGAAETAGAGVSALAVVLALLWAMARLTPARPAATRDQRCA